MGWEYMFNLDITELSLQNQVYLLRFLWEQDLQDFEKFKTALQWIEWEEEKYAFLNTFLVCSLGDNLWNEIIDIFSHLGFDNSIRTKILESYDYMMWDIEELVELTYKHYLWMLPEGWEVRLEKIDVLRYFISYAGHFFQDIRLSIEKNNIKEVLRLFQVFWNDIKWVFLIIDSMTLEELENVDFGSVLHNGVISLYMTWVNFWYIS